MFCKNCGAQSDDNQAFCKNCGTQFAQPQQAPVNQSLQHPLSPVQPPVNAAQGSTNKKIGIAVVGVAALVVVVLIFSLIFGGSDESKIEKLVDNIIKYSYTEDYDVEKLFDLYYYDAFQAVAYEYLEDDKDVDDDDLQDEFEDIYENMLDTIEDKLESSYESLADELDKDESISDILIVDFDFEIFDEKDDEYEDLEDWFDEYDIEINGVAIVEIEFEANYEGESFEYDFSVDLVKIGSKWYISDTGTYDNIKYY